MDALTLKPETAARLEQFAREVGKDPAVLADAAVEDWLARQTDDFEDACRGIEEGIADFLAGRSQPAEEALTDLRRKHGIPD